MGNKFTPVVETVDGLFVEINVRVQIIGKTVWILRRCGNAKRLNQR